MKRLSYVGFSVAGMIITGMVLFAIVVAVLILIGSTLAMQHLPHVAEGYWFALTGAVIAIILEKIRVYYVEQKRNAWAKKGIITALERTKAQADQVNTNYFYTGKLPYYGLETARLTRWSERSITAIKENAMSGIEDLVFEIDHYNRKLTFIQIIWATKGPDAAHSSPAWNDAASHVNNIAQWSESWQKQIREQGGGRT